MAANGREAALEALLRCSRDGAWSAAALDGVLQKSALDKRESALAARLFLGVLQNRDYCDYYIDFYRKGGEKLEQKLREILRLGVYQLLFLDKIPPRAAVNETVGLCRAAGLERAAGLCNAVLRRVAENREQLPPIPGEGTAEYLSLLYSHPLWLVRRLMEEHDYAFTEAFLRANNRPAGLTIQVNTLKVSPEDYRRALERRGIAFTEHPELPGCLSLPGGSVKELPGFEEGLFYVQDRAARLAVEAAAPEPGMRVLDACAAPGGKSFAAALRMENRGAILAWDIHEKKLRLIREGAARLGVAILSCQPQDARRPDASLGGQFDLVMADAPCSGLGVIGKRPEIRQKTEAEIAALPGIQREILDAVSACVKPGGALLYSTCTVLNAENRDVAAAFLEQHPDFAPEDFPGSENGMRAFWPQTDGTDGFFAAKFRRKN